MHICIIGVMKNVKVSQRIAIAISQARHANLTQSKLAKALGVSQSQISRIFCGRTSGQSKLAIDLCIYVSAVTKQTPLVAVSENSELMDAISTVWDGTPTHARALASVIRSLGLLQSHINVV